MSLQRFRQTSLFASPDDRHMRSFDNRRKSAERGERDTWNPMREPERTDEVRQDEWSLEMIFRWLEESAAFLYEIEAHRRPAHTSEPELSRRR